MGSFGLKDVAETMILWWTTLALARPPISGVNVELGLHGTLAPQAIAPGMTASVGAVLPRTTSALRTGGGAMVLPGGAAAGWLHMGVEGWGPRGAAGPAIGPLADAMLFFGNDQPLDVGMLVGVFGALPVGERTWARGTLGFQGRPRGTPSAALVVRGGLVF